MTNIVLIDDSVADNAIHERCIEDVAGTNILAVFTNAMSAVQWFELTERHVDIILLDINMPGMDGFEFLEKHKQFDSSKQAKHIIAMLGASLDQAGYDILQAFNAQWQDKPMTPESLTHWIDRLCH